MPTPESRRLARILAGWGAGARRVAEAIDVSHKTCLKHYSNELAEGAEAAEAAELAAHLNHIQKRPRSPAATSSAARAGGASAQAARPKSKATK